MQRTQFKASSIDYIRVSLGFVSYREEVFQVEWDPNHETVLASSADDRRLMVWDLNRYF